MELPTLDARPHLVIAGASGLIGRRLIAELQGRWRVTVLTREVSGAEATGATPLAWTPTAAKDGDRAHLEGLSRVLEGAGALVNLAGSPIAAGRFGAEHRRRIRDSRVDSTTTLVEAAARCERPPAVWLQASGTSIYGDRGDEPLDERSELGNDFLAEVGRAWEQAAASAAARSRLVICRTGIVLDREAEAWRRLVLPVRLFVGGPIGGGRQWWPWIHASDLTRALTFLLEHGEAEGVFALTAPEPARQIDLTRAAARVLRRPALVPVPAFALRIVFGGMADALLLPSVRLLPTRLLEHGFAFDYPNATSAAEELLAPARES